jgi:AbrB family looped-hinge helix DNA binding protein
MTMAKVLKVREKGVVILPKELREKAGIKEGSMVLATVVDEGILLSAKERDAVGKLLGLARLSPAVQQSSVERVRAMRAEINEQWKIASRKG